MVREWMFNQAYPEPLESQEKMKHSTIGPSFFVADFLTHAPIFILI